MNFSLNSIKGKATITIIVFILGFLTFSINEFKTFEEFINHFESDNSFIESLVSLLLNYIQVEVSIFYIKIISRFNFLGNNKQLELLFKSLILLLFNVITTFIVILLFKPLCEPKEISEYHFLSIMYSQMVIITFITSIYHNIFYLEQQLKLEKENDEVMIKSLKDREIANNAELTALKLQIDPHFMFNNFSILTELIETRTCLASDFLEKLSDVYRYIIQNYSHNFIRIEEEIAFLKAYLFLIKIRYEERINIEISNTVEEIEGEIPPVVLQLLVENAIKHNVASLKHPLTIKIWVEDQLLIVQNNLNIRKSNYNSTKVGQKNIFRRYELLNIRIKPQIIKSKTSYTVKLPIV
ncbi:histidine kinase [Halosquirtibacter xylanolyticus]|uniref:sensor histidine kinase n=1 Tax=Halosquirtibacter xylanolyticus TaxID=3374599 RepID=UPI00374A79F7|nr:histidine kinase [Prolixibacteraceae bacterium]